MLTQVLQILREAQQPLCAETLARMMNKDTDVVAAMLDELLVMERVVMDEGQQACEVCQLRSLCGMPPPGFPRYRLSTT